MFKFQVMLVVVAFRFCLLGINTIRRCMHRIIKCSHCSWIQSRLTTHLLAWEVSFNKNYPNQYIWALGKKWSCKLTHCIFFFVQILSFVLLENYFVFAFEKYECFCDLPYSSKMFWVYSVCFRFHFMVLIYGCFALINWKSATIEWHHTNGCEPKQVFSYLCTSDFFYEKNNDYEFWWNHHKKPQPADFKLNLKKQQIYRQNNRTARAIKWKFITAVSLNLLPIIFAF